MALCSSTPKTGRFSVEMVSRELGQGRRSEEEESSGNCLPLTSITSEQFTLMEDRRKITMLSTPSAPTVRFRKKGAHGTGSGSLPIVSPYLIDTFISHFSIFLRIRSNKRFSINGCRVPRIRELLKGSSTTTLAGRCVWFAKFRIKMIEIERRLIQLNKGKGPNLRPRKNFILTPPLFLREGICN